MAVSTVSVALIFAVGSNQVAGASDADADELGTEPDDNDGCI